jgi:hypothetical protein
MPPFPRAYGVAWWNGRPTLTADGKPVVLPSYCSCGPLWRDPWLAAHRNFARFSATHVYDEQDDVIYADTASVAVHAVMPGRREIRLPGRFRVRDVIAGKPASGATDRVTFDVKGPVTRWFRLEPAP